MSKLNELNLILLWLLLESPEVYNRIRLTQEEYDLLKEVLA